jgi:uncharacterized protein YjbI with pentapeptide repeats
MNDENAPEQTNSSEKPQDKKEQIDKQVAASAQPSSRASNDLDKVQLQKSFKRVHNPFYKFSHEWDLKREAKKQDMEIEEYRRLYKFFLESSKWYSRLWRWAGFEEKKLWDLFQLIIVPVVLAGGAFYLQDAAKQREQSQTEERTRAEQSQSEDRTRQERLNKYFDTMTDLLLESKLRTSERGSEVRTIARARTLTALRGLDKDRKGELLRFLDEAQLINNDGVIVPLFEANLQGANLFMAILQDDNLILASLKDANLRWAMLKNTNLEYTNLTNANLTNANLTGAKLTGAKLFMANLSEADLRGTDLSGANLKKANLILEQLIHAKLCKTTLPDGTVSNRDCGK